MLPPIAVVVTTYNISKKWEMDSWIWLVQLAKNRETKNVQCIVRWRNRREDARNVGERSVAWSYE